MNTELAVQTDAHGRLWTTHRAALRKQWRERNEAGDVATVGIIVDGRLTASGEDVAEVVPRTTALARLEGVITERARGFASAATLFGSLIEPADDVRTRRIAIVAARDEMVDWILSDIGFSGSVEGTCC